MSKNSYFDDSSSAQRRAQEAISGKPGYSIAIAQFISEAFVALDQAWRVTYINHQATPLLQRTREDLIGRNFWEAFPEVVGTGFYQRCLEAASTGLSARFEIETRDHQKWFRTHILPSTEGIDLLLIDVTQQKRAEEQLLFQSTILGNIQDSIIATDLEGKITYWNGGASTIYGYSAEEMIGQSIGMLYPGRNPSRLARDLQGIFKGYDYVGGWKGQRKDDTTVWVDIRMSVAARRGGQRNWLHRDRKRYYGAQAPGR